MEKLTKDLAEKLKTYLESIRGDYQDGDINAAIEVIDPNIDRQLNKVDAMILSRMIEDTELAEEVDCITMPEETGNAFD